MKTFINQLFASWQAFAPGSLIAITNWTGKALTGLTITLPRNGMQGVPTTVINPIIS